MATAPKQELQKSDVNSIDGWRKRTNIDRRKCSRVVPMKVLCLGSSRTGTSSIRQALIDLGYADCYHFSSVFQENPKDAIMWNEAFDAKFEGKGKLFTRKEWDQLLGHCQAITDVPCTLFYKELLEAYPDAKVILSVRDNVDQWYKSQQATIATAFEALDEPEDTLWNRIYNYLTPAAPETVKWYNNVYKHYPVIRGLHRDRREGTEQTKEWYNEWNEEIKRIVPADKLLVMNVKQGWDPLCKFLGEDVPSYPFPRRNDSATFQKNTVQLNFLVGAAVKLKIAQYVLGAIGTVVLIYYLSKSGAFIKWRQELV